MVTIPAENKEIMLAARTTVNQEPMSVGTSKAIEVIKFQANKKNMRKLIPKEITKT